MTAAVDEVVPRAEVLDQVCWYCPFAVQPAISAPRKSQRNGWSMPVAAAGAECQVGIADQLATAVFAARSGQVVAPGADGQFLAGLSIRQLACEPSLSGPGRTELADLLWRMGIRTFGQFAALPGGMCPRGSAPMRCWHTGWPPVSRTRAVRSGFAPELDAVLNCDPPVERVDAAAFAGRTLAAALHRSLESAGVGAPGWPSTPSPSAEVNSPGMAVRRAAD